MATVQVTVPRFGESLTEGRLSRWLKADGAIVKEDDALFELETDKATPEVPAPTAGKLKILVKEGTTVAVDSVVAEIDTSVTASNQAGGGRPSPAPATPQAAAVESKTQASPSAGSRPPLASATNPPPGPAASRLLAESNLSPSQVPGSGPAGRITKGDVLTAIEAQAAKPEPTKNGPPAPVATARGTERKPMTTIRKRIAERLLESQNTTATLTTFNEADLTAVTELRAKYNERFEKKHGVKLGFMSIFVKAAVNALKAFPLVNARIEGNDLVFQHFYDIGVAVSTEKGLMVPILRNADAMGFADIEKAIGDVAKRARDGKISIADMEGGTFTITNGGIFGSMLSTPILNPPQAAILGMHTIQKRAVVVDDEIVIRPMMYLALSYDHRQIDGREAVQFLVRIKECVENPERMLFEI